ncbi:hypothetical protein KI387_016318, partial [Taxus chinensis]
RVLDSGFQKSHCRQNPWAVRKHLTVSSSYRVKKETCLRKLVASRERKCDSCCRAIPGSRGVDPGVLVARDQS